jgi:hypothetical protein
MTDIAGVTKPSSLRTVVRMLVRERRRRRRAPAEPSGVVAELSRLGSGWHVLDQIAAATPGRLEQLVIGPGGVFAVTGHHQAGETICLGAGSLLVDGARIHHGRTGRGLAADVSRRLSESVGDPVSVTALVLIVGDRRFVVPRQRDDAVVRVATPTGAVRWMRRRKPVLSAADVELVHAAARRPETWHMRGARASRDTV